MVFKTPSAEFDLLPSGYLQSFLVSNGKRLTLDEPDGDAAPESAEINGKNVGDFKLDFSHVKISEARGKLGAKGKRVEVTARSSSPAAVDIEKVMTFEVYDDFPNLLVMSEVYKNTGSKPIELGRVNFQAHRLNASQVDPRVPPFRMWSFQGSSYQWGKDDVMEISEKFAQPNLFGPPGKDGTGGGSPGVAFWTAAMGEAVGHL